MNSSTVIRWSHLLASRLALPQSLGPVRCSRDSSDQKPLELMRRLKHLSAAREPGFGLHIAMSSLPFPQELMQVEDAGSRVSRGCIERRKDFGLIKKPRVDCCRSSRPMSKFHSSVYTSPEEITMVVASHKARGRPPGWVPNQRRSKPR